MSSTHVVTHHAADKPVIVMIHGFRGTHHGLDLVARNLPDFHVIIPDLPGFGQTPAFQNVHSIEQYVSWMNMFITDLHLSSPPIVLGHSFGSIITSAYAARYPESLSKLVLVNPIGAPALEGPKAVLTQLAILYYFIGRKLPAKVANAWLSWPPIVMIMSQSMAKTSDKHLRAYIHDQHLQHFSSFHSPTVVAEAFHTSVHHTVREFAAQISTPTLLIAGALDDITPLHKQQELVVLFSDARLVVIDNVGHLTHYETPDQVASAVQAFIKSV